MAAKPVCDVKSSRVEICRSRFAFEVIGRYNQISSASETVCKPSTFRYGRMSLMGIYNLFWGRAMPKASGRYRMATAVALEGG